MTTHQDEQRLRKAVLENERNLHTTLHQFAQAEADNVQGRFKPWETSKVTGAQPTVEYPRQQSWSNELANAVGPEAPIDGRDCGDTFGVALGEPHEQFCEDDGPENSSFQGSADLGNRAQAKLETSSLPASPSSTPMQKRKI